MLTMIKDNTEPTGIVLQTLKEHLPYSLPTLRRIQFLETAGGIKTQHTHVLSTFDTESPGRDFLVACLDFFRGPDTEMWLYSSLEHPSMPGDEAVCLEQLVGLLQRVREIELAFERPREEPGVVMIGSLHKKLVQFLQRRDRIHRLTPEHFKYLFSVEDLPPAKELPEGLEWSSVRPEDMSLVLSRTSIPYQARLMKMYPSVSIVDQGVPIAWVFLGPDGSLKVLHCEEKYRGRGLAKAVSLKLFRDMSADLVQDGLYHADVDVANLQSQGVSRSLKGTTEWTSYFAWIKTS